KTKHPQIVENHGLRVFFCAFWDISIGGQLVKSGAIGNKTDVYNGNYSVSLPSFIFLWMVEGSMLRALAA
ncbi:MAG: hypothetical protein RSD32_07825, partial [Oscillospiraceae bacterium]